MPYIKPKATFSLKSRDKVLNANLREAKELIYRQMRFPTYEVALVS